MAKLIGENKINAAVFISGRGSNLKSLIYFSKKKNSPINIELIVSDNQNAKGLEYAKINRIRNIVINYNRSKNSELKILKILKEKKIKIICLAGFMKILSKRFINKFKHPILNIHPSLLPKYKGLNTHKRVINKKEKFTGCTVHFVNHRLDSGKIILQKKIKIYKTDTTKSLEKRLLKHEHKIYPEAIKKVIADL